MELKKLKQMEATGTEKAHPNREWHSTTPYIMAVL
jgi:hypothetical protein